MMTAGEEWNRKAYVHSWVRKHKPKQDYCTICNDVKKLELSNLSGEYHRDSNDFWWLCKSCHKLYDMVNNTHTIYNKIDSFFFKWNRYHY